jgi:hypothetical protein
MHSEFLGSGMSSRVFAICNQDNHILKVMTDEEERQCYGSSRRRRYHTYPD